MLLLITFPHGLLSDEQQNTEMQANDVTQPPQPQSQSPPPSTAPFAPSTILAENGEPFEDADTAALFEATREANIAKMIDLLGHSHIDYEARSTQGWTFLMHAIASKDPLSTTRLILQHEDIAFSVIDATEDDGWTALHFATFHGLQQVVRHLLEHGADASIANNAGILPHSIAEARGDSHLAKDIIDHAVLDALRHNDIPQMMALIREGGNVDGHNDVGWTPLMAAAAANDTAAVIELVDNHPVTIDAAEGDGWTPLMFCAVNGHKEIAEYLISKGADLNHRSHTLQSAYSLALTHSPEMAHMFESEGLKRLEEMEREGVEPEL